MSINYPAQASVPPLENGKSNDKLSQEPPTPNIIDLSIIKTSLIGSANQEQVSTPELGKGQNENQNEAKNPSNATSNQRKTVQQQD